MAALESSTDRLRILSRLAASLNRSADVRGDLTGILEHLLEAMDLQAGWIMLSDPQDRSPQMGPGFILAAHHGLPASISLEHQDVWDQTCICEGRCHENSMAGAYNESGCPRLDQLRATSGGPMTHATAPLTAGGRSLGVINVADAAWRPLDKTCLALLQQAGREIGEALSRARAYEQLLARRVDEQSALLKLSRKLLAHRSLDDLIACVLNSAREVLGADASALLLRDEQQEALYFRGTVGWRRDPTQAGRRLRANRRCRAWEAINRQQPIVIDDMSQSEFGPAGAWWARGESFQSQTIVPLTIASRSIGVLVLNTRDVRPFDASATRYLQLLAQQAALALDSAALREHEADQDRLQNELVLAHDIQHLLQPDLDIDIPGWDLASTYRAAQAVGGDFYDVLMDYSTPGRIGLLIGDVSGKSISGALLMAAALSTIRNAARSTPDPAAALQRANTRIRRIVRADRFISVFLGWLDTRSGHLTYACAGQNAPLLHRAGAATAQELAAPGIVLGVLETPSFETRHTRLSVGDALVLYTDGVTEAQDENHDLFGENRLAAAVVRSPDGPSEVVLERILHDVHCFVGEAPQSDDLTVMVIHRQPRTSSTRQSPTI